MAHFVNFFLSSNHNDSTNESRSVLLEEAESYAYDNRRLRMLFMSDIVAGSIVGTS